MIVCYNKLGFLDNDKGPAIVDNRNVFFFKDGKPFRDGYLPTFTVNGNQFYFRNYKLRNSRVNCGIEYLNGSKDYFINNYKYKTVSKIMTLYFNRQGLLHRSNGPALIHNKVIEYYNNGNLNRVNGPARIFKEDNGFSLFWYSNGVLHRNNDQPAIIKYNGDIFYYVNGKAHRSNGKPAVMLFDGTQKWYVNGLLERDQDLPAIQMGNGDLHWFKNNLRHRNNNLPAVIKINGKQQYWQYGFQY